MWYKLNQRGAMFGMDARIALVAMGVIAASISTIGITHISEQKVHRTTQHINALHEGIMGVYKSAPLTYVTTGLTDPTLEALQMNSRYGNNDGEDAWNRPYVITRVNTTKTISGESVPVIFFTITSNGPNGVAESIVIASEANYQSWGPGGDDIGFKFSTYAFAREAVLDSQRRLNEISSKLKQYERGIFETLRTYCDTPANQLLTNCDFDSNGSYTTDEEFQINLYPRLNGEATALKYYSATTYTSGNAASMQSMLTAIGFDNSTTSPVYIYDLLGRTLRYTSNATGATRAPFAARVWYQ